MVLNNIVVINFYFVIFHTIIIYIESVRFCNLCLKVTCKVFMLCSI